MDKELTICFSHKYPSDGYFAIARRGDKTQYLLPDGSFGDSCTFGWYKSDAEVREIAVQKTDIKSCRECNVCKEKGVTSQVWTIKDFNPLTLLCKFCGSRVEF